MPLYLSALARRALESHAEQAYPDECCGLILGRDLTENRREILSILSAENTGDTRSRASYSISPETFLSGYLEAQARQQEVLGVYHSHPNKPSAASECDRINAFPFWSYLIVSCMNGKCDRIQSWLLREDRSVFDEETIHHTT